MVVKSTRLLNHYTRCTEPLQLETVKMEMTVSAIVFARLVEVQVDRARFQ